MLYDARYDAHFSDPRVALGDVETYLRRRVDTLAAADDVAEACSRAVVRLRLAVHEWLANLARHACFEGREPVVRVSIWRGDALLRGLIEDNARRFDAAARLAEPPSLSVRVRALPEDGGLGLPLMQASTERVAYDAVPGGGEDAPRNRLHLVVRPRGKGGAGESNTGESNVIEVP